MFEPNQNVRIKNGTHHNLWPDKQVYGLVVRMMGGGEYVIVNTGDEYDLRVRTEDLEAV